MNDDTPVGRGRHTLQRSSVGLIGSAGTVIEESWHATPRSGPDRAGSRWRALSTRKVTTVLLVLTVATGCDHFDFGRVFGRPRGSAEPVAPAPPPKQADAEPEPESLVLAFGGSIRFEGESRQAIEQGRYDLLGAIEPITRDAGVIFAELGTPLYVPPNGKSPSFVAPLTASAVLARGGVDGVALSWSVPSYAPHESLMDSTLQALDQVGVRVAAPRGDAGTPPAPLRLEAAGRSVAIVSVARDPGGAAGAAGDEALPQDADRSRTDRWIETVKRTKKDHDVVVVTLHGGDDRATEPTEARRATSRAALEAGADAVIGYGSRHPQGVGWVDGHPVFYGLGNWIAEPTEGEPWTARGLIAKLSWSPEGGTQVEACPYLIEGGRPEPLSGSSRRSQEGVFRRTLQRLSVEGKTVGLPGAHSCMPLTPPE